MQTIFYKPRVEIKEVTVLCLEGLSNRGDKDIESSC